MPPHGVTLTRGRVAAAAVVALLGVAGCADDAPGTRPSGAGVALGGRVIGYRTGSPSAGVSVVFDSLSPRLHLTATTDASGSYLVQVSEAATFDVRVDGAAAGQLLVHSPGVVGDLFVDGGTCSARYGVLYDNRTLRPVPGATVAASGQQAQSDSRGWYLLPGEDCPSLPQFGGTTFMRITHPDFEPASVVVGRGFQAVRRHDLVLTRK